MRPIRLLSLLLLAALLVPASVFAGASLSARPIVKTEKTAHLGTILATAKGFTLYRYTPDKHDKSNCTGACAQLWPPALFAKGTKLIKPRGVPGKLGLIPRHGSKKEQLTYNSEPLYTYSVDKKPGQVHGEAVGKVWYVVHV